MLFAGLLIVCCLSHLYGDDDGVSDFAIGFQVLPILKLQLFRDAVLAAIVLVIRAKLQECACLPMLARKDTTSVSARLRDADDFGKIWVLQGISCICLLHCMVSKRLRTQWCGGALRCHGCQRRRRQSSRVRSCRHCFAGRKSYSVCYSDFDIFSLSQAQSQL